jgi:hypothetical protein
MPGPNKEMARVARNLIRENEDVRLTVKELEGRGVLGRKAELEIGRAFSDVFGRHGMECPIGGPRCFEGCAKGNLALNYSPMSYTTERPSVPYRSVGSGGTDAHMCGTSMDQERRDFLEDSARLGGFALAMASAPWLCPLP